MIQQVLLFFPFLFSYGGMILLIEKDFQSDTKDDQNHLNSFTSSSSVGNEQSITSYSTESSIKEYTFNRNEDPDWIDVPDPFIPLKEDHSLDSTDTINELDQKRNGFGLSHNVQDIEFKLYYTETFPKRYDAIYVNQDATIRNARFQIDKPITIITHGFMSSSRAPNSTVPLIKNALLDNGIRNIIAVDWRRLSTSDSPVAFLSYVEVTQNVPIVGERIGELIQLIIELGIVKSPLDFHLIGHSLGAHVMGVAGRYIYNRTGIPIGHITGLDPAGPLYQFINKDNKLDPSDAKFIDVLHTDIGMFGSSEILGTVDFYANGGKGYAQPGCLNFTTNNLGSFIQGISGICSHSRAYRLYARSIRRIPPELFGCRCRISLPTILPSSCTPQELALCPERVLFGYYVPNSAKGTYYIETKDATDIQFFSGNPLPMIP